jgi:hypothetical protein
MGNRRTRPRDITSLPEQAERAAKTHDLSEGTEPVVRLCSRRSEKEP